jgi:hypothetical protein
MKVRVTVDIDESIKKEAHIFAINAKMSLAEIVEWALREFNDKNKKSREKFSGFTKNKTR